MHKRTYRLPCNVAGSSHIEGAQTSACLILGSLARSLNTTDPERATQIEHHLRTWLLKDHGIIIFVY